MNSAKHLNWVRATATAALAILLSGLGAPVLAAEDEEAAQVEKTQSPAAARPVRSLAPKTTRSATRRTPVKPTTRKASARGTKIPVAANTAVQELRREFELGKLRRKSEYFTEKPNAEITADVVMALLQRRLGSSEPMDAYVKWQLLSALPAEIPEQYVGDAVAAYMEAPRPEIRPGITDADKRELDREVSRTDDPAELVKRLIAQGREVDMLNQPVLAYRDELFARLPGTADTFRAALKDLYDRGMAGISPRSQVSRVSDRIVKWAPEAEPADAEALLAAVDELSSIQMPDYYDTPRFAEGDKKYVWGSRRAKLNESKRLDDAAEALERRMGRGGGDRSDRGDRGGDAPPDRGRPAGRDRVNKTRNGR